MKYFFNCMPSRGVPGPIYRVKRWFIRVQRSNIEKLYFFDFFFFRSGGAPGRLGGYRGLLRSEKSIKIIGFMLGKKTCIIKEISSPYFGDQKCDV